MCPRAGLSPLGKKNFFHADNRNMIRVFTIRRSDDGCLLWVDREKSHTVSVLSFESVSFGSLLILKSYF